MESEKSKVETLFGEVEQRLADTSKLTVAERRKELAHLEPALVTLTREFERFQMIAFNKYPVEIDEMEERLTRIKASVARMSVEDITLSGIEQEPKLQESAVVMEEPDPTTQLVALTNAKLDEGKARALNMLKLANNMRDELNMMDDEVMLQREKLLSINNQIKHAQSVTNQTKKIVSYFTKAVNDDKIVRGLIVVVALLLLVIISMALSIKLRRGQLVELKMVQEKEAQDKADYSKIDEKYFANLANSLDLDMEKGFAAAQEKLQKRLKKYNPKEMAGSVQAVDSGLPVTPKPAAQPEVDAQEATPGQTQAQEAGVEEEKKTDEPKINLTAPQLLAEEAEPILKEHQPQGDQETGQPPSENSEPDQPE